MSTPWLYRVARPAVRLLARIYFRRIEVAGAERVPAGGPVVLAANHPQSITDGLVLALASDRVVHYVAHSGLFRSAIRGKLLAWAGVIPVHRPSDVADAGARNLETFEACRRLLERGGCLGIFPEGTSQDERRVQRFKTGTARIALEAEVANDFGLSVVIVPAGLSFQSARRLRSRVLVSFGEPLRVDLLRDDHARDPEGTVRALTERLQEAVRRRVVDVPRSELEALVQDVERVYRRELSTRDGKGPRASFGLDQAYSREIARAVDHFHRTRPEFVAELTARLEEYRRKLDRVGLADRMLRGEARGFARTAAGMAVFGALGAPLAIYGALFNYLPYHLTEAWVAFRRPDPTKVHYTQLAFGAPAFAAVYSLLAWIVWLAFGGWAAVAFALTLVPTGIFARWYFAVLGAHRRHLRYAWLRATHGWLVAKLQGERGEIVALMDGAVAEYTAARAASAEDPEEGARR